jgi:hypothetical protein
MYISSCILFVGFLFVSCGLAGYIPPMPRKSAPETYKVYSMDKVYTGLKREYAADCRVYFKKDGKTIMFSGTFIAEQE